MATATAITMMVTTAVTVEVTVVAMGEAMKTVIVAETITKEGKWWDNNICGSIFKSGIFPQQYYN